MTQATQESYNNTSTLHSPFKPLPALPQPPAYHDDEPYYDLPSPNSLQTAHSQTPYSDNPPTPSYTQSDPDNIPLARLSGYPADEPPSYAIAVRQSYRETLMPHIHIPRSDAQERDEERGETDWDRETGEMERADDVRHDIEKVVAMFVVAVALLVVSAVMGWLIIMG